MIYPRFLWSDDNDGGHRAVFDTYYQQDIWESLRKVDMHLDSYQVGDKTAPENKADQEDGSTPLMRTASALRTMLDNGIFRVAQTEFWKSVGDINETAKQSLSKKMTDYGLIRPELKEHSQRMYDFSNFDMEGFLKEGEE